jgi:hypothetical protein
MHKMRSLQYQKLHDHSASTFISKLHVPAPSDNLKRQFSPFYILSLFIDVAIFKNNDVFGSRSASIQVTVLFDPSNESSAHDKSFGGYAIAHPQKLTEIRTLTFSKNRQVENGKYQVFPPHS